MSSASEASPPPFTPGRFAGRTAIVTDRLEQLAATITWLLSDDASNVNGAIVPSDGGWSAI
jgi:NAD(P)-dependent dehydrogenase (short-subunit alcohol dehydrogenase family)